MAFVRQTVEGKEDPAPDPHVFVVAKADFFGDLVRCLEADPPDVIRQPVGILLDDVDALLAVGLEDLGRMRRGDIVALQKEHDILDLPLLLPSLFDPLHAELPDPGDLVEAVRLLLNDAQGVRAELADDLAGKFGADSLDQAGAQIFFHAEDRGGKGLLIALHGELPAVLGIDPPAALHDQDRAHVHLGHGTHHRHEVSVVFHPALDDAVTVFRVLIGDALHHAAQTLHNLFLIVK